MIKQGETLLMVGKLERTPTDTDATESVADLSGYDIYVALTQGSRVVKQLLVTKESGYFTATLPPESTCYLRGDFGIEAAMVVDGTTIISDNVEGITIESSALGRALHRVTPESTAPSYTPEVESETTISNISNTYDYCIKLSIVGSEVAINNPTEDDERIFTLNFENILVGKSAYEIAVDYGYEGTEEEWINSLYSTTSMRTLYTAKGDFTYNATTGYYEKGSITDLTESDMADIFATYTYTYSTQEGAYAYSTARATPTFNVYAIDSAAYTFAYSDVEYVDFGSTLSYWISGNAIGLFFYCTSLREIEGVIDLVGVNYLSNMFFKCSSLESVMIDSLTTSISFAYSPLLSAESVFYIISHSDAPTGITLTLHEDCYNRLLDDDRFGGGLEFYASLFNIGIAVA